MSALPDGAADVPVAEPVQEAPRGRVEGVVLTSVGEFMTVPLRAAGTSSPE